jgi:DNA gyrase subunit A
MAEETGGLTPGRQSIIPINIEDEMRGAYIDYSMSVIISRALPDVRDMVMLLYMIRWFAWPRIGLCVIHW